MRHEGAKLTINLENLLDRMPGHRLQHQRIVAAKACRHFLRVEVEVRLADNFCFRKMVNALQVGVGKGVPAIRGFQAERRWRIPDDRLEFELPLGRGRGGQPPRRYVLEKRIDAANRAIHLVENGK